MTAMTDHGIEYGVLLNRTSIGLGFLLLAVFANRDRAEARAEECRVDNAPHPATVNVRDVRRSEWRELPPACPTCSGPSRETVGMVCQTCGIDYGAVTR